MKKNKKAKVEEKVEAVENDVVELEPLTVEQEIGALRRVHEYLREFDRVPGSMASTWSQMLDTIAVVANSLIAKLPEEELQKMKNQ